MNICPITYQECGDDRYSIKGLRSLNLTKLHDLPYTQEEQLREAAMRADKMSIQGVQPKLSAKLDVRGGGFAVVDRGGEFILKPQNVMFPELPENESLTMKLAGLAGIEVPLNGMIYSSDGRFTYFIKRFDRYGKNKKVAVEDFAQLAGMSRETKYDYSMEKLVLLIDRFCTFPAIEKVKLFRRTLFNFLTGNEDMHLKNFSVIVRDDKVTLSPAYDLLNTTIALSDPKEEIALPVGGKKNNLTKELLIDYFGRDRLQLNHTIVSQQLAALSDSRKGWEEMITASFLSEGMKRKYLKMINERSGCVGL
ncbi:MAG TPA: HipA domain-containing protein [Spirochaetota bacterium]|nr:HipA domain-containing protein [Spirochaetota bacterium]